MKQRKPYRTFSREFKLEAVRLMQESERPAAEIARELGIPRNRLYKWKEQLARKGDQAFTGPGRPKQEELSEVARLRQENARLKEENEILKKAAAYFAKDLE